MAALKAGSISRETPLSQVMARNVIALQLHDRASMVDTLMKAHPIHHIPVMDGKVLKGLISQGDLFRNMLSPHFYDSEKEQHSFLDSFLAIPSLMTEDPITLGPDNTLGEALDLVLEYRVGCIPIVDESNELLGILTTSDLLRLFRQVLPKTGSAPARPRAGQNSNKEQAAQARG